MDFFSYYDYILFDTAHNTTNYSVAIGGIAGYFIFKNKDNNKLEYDFETGMIVKNRVDKAQYLPNLNLLVENTQQIQLMSAINYYDILLYGYS